MAEEKKGFFKRLVSGLAKTRDNIVAGFDSIFSGFSSIDEDFYEELEEILIMSDMVIDTTMNIIEDLKKKVKENKIKEPEECRQLLIDSIKDQMRLEDSAYDFIDKKSVVLVIGVNGVGKTTSVGKLAASLKGQGKKVLLAAADTFRAGAIEQLKEWSNRAGVDIISQAEGADPAAVVYDAVAAAKEAIEQSGLDMTKEDPFRVGCSVGSGIGSMQVVEKSCEILNTKGPGRLNPLMIPLLISNMASGNVSIQFGLRGKNINVVTACATGTHSIGEAYRTIQCSDADVMVAGGTEAAITPTGFGGFAALTALTSSTDPERCSIPFDKERSGFVMGEGAGVVVLEELQHAKARGAKILGEVVGYGATGDAYHITSPAEDGSGAAKAMEWAVKEAGISTDDVWYVNAHGTSTHHNDLFETIAIKKTFGEHAKEMKINSTKSITGHLLGAAGAVEVITCVKELQEGLIHQTVGYKVPDEQCDLDYVGNGNVKMDIKYALTNSLGFGGHNASLLIKKYED